MADNIAVTEGAGKNVATDDVAGAQYQRIKVDLGGDGAASPLLAGQQAKTGSLPVTLASDEDSVQAIGSAAHNAAATENPVRIGGTYKSLASGDVVGDGDAAEIYVDPVGHLVLGRHGDAFKTNNNYSTAQTNTQQQAAPGAGLSLHVKSVQISADGTAAGSLKLVEDTGGTPVDVWGPVYFPATAGMQGFVFDPPIKLTAVKNLGVTSTGTTNLTVSIQGYTAP